MGADRLRGRHGSLGEVLVELGVLTRAQMEVALQQAAPDQRNLGAVIVSLGYATEEKIDNAVSIRLGIPYFTTFDGMLEPAAAKFVPEAMARKFLLVPIFPTEDVLMVGMVNPYDTDALDEVARVSGLHAQPVLTTLSNLFESIQQVYGHKPIHAAGSPERAGGSVADSVSDIVNSILHEGLARRASDIHIESGPKSARVRFRVDGMLIEGKSFPKHMEAALVVRIKILAKLDITETRLPQDGHLRFVYGGREIDVRLSTLPTVHGEKVAMRLLDSNKALRRLPELGIDPSVLSRFSDAIRNPNGLILVTGPTGSGKTTTLYAALAELNSPERNITTLEDPVEYVIENINQIEAFPKIGLTFAAGLRSILRQDPNIILVGEIRDRETAEIALQASITGHLVFSTLHTNDAASSVHRLFNMGIEAFMVTAALRGVLAQRLMRRLCPKCKRPHKLSAEETAEIGAAAAKASCFEPVGCDSCFNTGYQGRVPIHEWFEVTRSVRELVSRRASVDELRAASAAAGLKTMRQAALEKALSGDTSFEEVARLTREQSEA